MLGREQFRRRHQSRLAAVFDGLKHGAQGHHGLAGAHVALQQTVHRPPGGEICRDLVQRPLLRGGERKRKTCIEGLRYRQGTWIVALPVPAGPHHGNAEGIQEKLFEYQPLPGQLQSFRRSGPVDLRIGGAQRHEVLHQVPGQIVRQLLLLHGLKDQILQRLGGEPFGQGIDRDHAARHHRRSVQPFHHGVEDLLSLFVPGQSSVKAVGLAGLQIFAHPWLVEPGDPDLCGAVGDAAAGGVETAPDVAGPWLGDHHGGKAPGLSGNQLGDGAELRPVLIGPREIGDQILQRADPQLLQQRGLGTAHAPQSGDGV